MTQTQLSSPRLLALRRHLRTGDRGALGAFWQEVREQGTPLIEPVPGDSRHALVTFLWRGAELLTNVVVVSPVLSFIPAETRLRRVPATDIWYRTYRLPADLRFSYRLSVNDPLARATKLTPAQRVARITVGQTDPLNRRGATLYFGGAEWSSAALPAAPSQRYVERRAAAARGQVQEHTLHSDLLGNDRPVWVYTPPGYTTAGRPYGLVLLLDGQAYTSATAPTPVILDNLLADGAIPPLVAVLVSSIDPPTRSRELACHEPFIAFLAEELLPWVRQQVHVTTDPTQTIVGGASLGGLAAAFAAFRRPNLFGNVLSQSGSFWWSAGDHFTVGGHYEEPEWLTREFARSEALPVRFYVEAGLLEHREPATISLLQANRHLRDVLRAKGYDVHFHEDSGGHDFAWWRGTLADGLQVLAGNTTRRGMAPDRPTFEQREEVHATD